jgi:uncharacterized cupin superfamily protein
MTGFAFDPAELELEPGPASTSERVLATTPDGVVTGVWEIEPGVATDVEVDETFVVVSGRATVEIEGGPTLELAPGTVGVLHAGDRTVWRVSETLRKVYVAGTSSSSVGCS